MTVNSSHVKGGGVARRRQCIPSLEHCRELCQATARLVGIPPTTIHNYEPRATRGLEQGLIYTPSEQGLIYTPSEQGLIYTPSEQGLIYTPSEQGFRDGTIWLALVKWEYSILDFNRLFGRLRAEWRERKLLSHLSECRTDTMRQNAAPCPCSCNHNTMGQNADPCPCSCNHNTPPYAPVPATIIQWDRTPPYAPVPVTITVTAPVGWT
ncbi:hypothetical protein AVEN_162027-1 [Araneus ventricosus]|uniref:Uncharacterized protein n=1 Tax=Araneus ventricosus TaxID=182803 RepID=A0A4Y2F7G4_ARAVE|nr:hypothetical protein AVEN_162027-1 [Araneus ventricosus]